VCETSLDFLETYLTKPRRFRVEPTTQYVKQAYKRAPCIARADEKRGEEGRRHNDTPYTPILRILLRRLIY
jgi:hypothetical protein